MTFSRASLHLFAELLAQSSLPATDPDIEKKAAVVGAARRELEAALKDLPIMVPLAEAGAT